MRVICALVLLLFLAVSAVPACAGTIVLGSGGSNNGVPFNGLAPVQLAYDLPSDACGLATACDITNIAFLPAGAFVGAYQGTVDIMLSLIPVGTFNSDFATNGAGAVTVFDQAVNLTVASGNFNQFSFAVPPFAISNNSGETLVVYVSVTGAAGSAPWSAFVGSNIANPARLIVGYPPIDNFQLEMQLTTAPVPEPSTLPLLAGGIGVAIFFRKRRARP